MSSHSLNIPNTTLPVGSRTFGPFSIGSNSNATLTVDRTVAGGLDSLDPTSTLQVTIQSSPDGGVTWSDEVSTTWIGGILVNPKNGVQYTTSSIEVFGLDGGRNSCRVMTVVAGPASISITGSVLVS